MISPIADIDDLKVFHRGDARFAFVDLCRREDVARVVRTLDDWLLPGGRRLSAKAYVQGDRDGRRAGPLHDGGHPPYSSVVVNSRLPSDHQRPRLLVSHLSASATGKDVGQLFEGISITPDLVKLVWTKQNNQCAYVDLKTLQECQQAIRELDGTVLLGEALNVVWVFDDMPSRDVRRRRGEDLHFNFVRCELTMMLVGSTSEAPRATSSAPPRRAEQASSRPPSPPRASQPRSPPPRSPTLALTPVSLPNDPSLATDIARLERLDLSRADMNLIQRVWEPLEQPPSDGFDRTINIDVSFGYLSPAEAKAALQLPPLFPDDEAKQARYELFLRSQTGESRDHYTVSVPTPFASAQLTLASLQIFLAQLAEFNARNRQFSEFAARVARTTSPLPPPPSYEPQPAPRDYTVEPTLCGPTAAPPKERSGSFEVSGRVASAFGCG